ncbi:MAG: hypothetical protein M3Q05_10835, partial [Bacteroidota bacterium]|nr:hypothetical protein [Bacteroidota bacterium]
GVYIPIGYRSESKLLFSINLNNQNDRRPIREKTFTIAIVVPSGPGLDLTQQKIAAELKWKQLCIFGKYV